MRVPLLTLALAIAVVPRESPETLEMAGLLKERIAAVDPLKMPFLLNQRRAALLAEELEWPRPRAERLGLRYNLAAELLNAGRIQESLSALDALDEDAKQNAELWRTMPSAVRLLRGLAYLRLGEEENCHLGNTPDSCLLPIRGQGIHVKRAGSTRAAAIFAQILDTEPDNLQARWLLNVAHMTLGSYPEGVPTKQLIAPDRFASEYPLPRFPNVAREAGLDTHAVAGGAVLDDFDNDGRLDLMVSAMGLEDPLRFFHNRGDGGFDERSAAEMGLTGVVGGLNLVQADYDNDGFVDVLVLRGGWMRSEGRFPFSLLRNRGDGTFTDVTRAAGLLRFAPSQTATWFDYDGDGWLDLFVGNESAPLGTPDTSLVHRCELYHSNRDGTFTNVARETGVDFVGYVKGVTSGDYDNDGRPDLYVSVQGGDNALFHNDGPTSGGGWRFTNVAPAAGVVEPKDSFGTFFFDYDNDGRRDLFVAGYSWTTAADVAADYLRLPTPVDRGRLYHNKGDGTFADLTRQAGLYRVVPAMGHNFGDLDNDGFLDIYLGTGTPELATLVPNRMFRNDAGRAFQDVTSAGNFGHLQKGHAVCFGDIDNDGDQDIFEEMGGAQAGDTAYSTLYENPGNSNRWLGLQLEGVRSNRGAIGARIKVVVVGARSASRSIYRTVGSGGSFGGSPLRQEIGLGDATRITSVEIFWPATGQTQLVTGVQFDRRYRLREGAAEIVPLKGPRFRLGGAARPKP